MSKQQIVYSCSKCGAQTLKWSGRCLECGEWGSLSEEIIDIKKHRQNLLIKPTEIIDFNSITNEEKPRFKTNIAEADRVFGGGIVPGSLILLAGEPGIGKSTMIAQLAHALGQKGALILYASGEESGEQIKERLKRINCSFYQIKFIAETNVEKIITSAENIKSQILIIDSIQTMHSSEIEGEAGGVTQIRASAAKFLELAKKKNITIILIGHVTKDGIIAGPKTLEHIVDTVVYLETETLHDYRILRATKNRFGSINEVGIFEMTKDGFKEIKNPSAAFVDNDYGNLSGAVLSTIIEGTRPFLVEVQALVTKTIFGYPQRKATGFDLNRLQILTAVLNKRAKINLSNQDIILNIVGGIKINDPGLDVAIAAAIISSLLNQIIDRKIIFLGEIGLGGEIRNINRIEQRITEAEKLGFTTIIAPYGIKGNYKIKIKNIKNVNDLADIIKK